MSLSLKLELKADNKVLVTNSETNDKKEVTIGFLQEIAGDSLLLLAQYRSYELFINADRHWQRILSFNPKLEQTKEMLLEQKFRNIMLGDRGIDITDYEGEMYTKALAWVGSYNLNINRKSIDGTALLAGGSGAVAGAMTSNVIGGVGVAAGGTAFGVGMLGLATMGTVAGLAAYGISRALD